MTPGRRGIARGLVLLCIAFFGVGCLTAGPGGRDPYPVHAVPGGWLEGYSQYSHVHYVVDKASQTCWMLMFGAAMSRMDCCDMRRVESTRKLISWESEENCRRPAPPVAVATRIAAAPEARAPAPAPSEARPAAPVAAPPRPAPVLPGPLTPGADAP